VSPPSDSQLLFHSRRGRRVLWATVLGSGLVSLDATVVNVALPTIGRDLGGGITALQWVVNGYTLALVSLLLFGGALGDRYGRRRLFVIGVIWFTLASIACGLSRSTALLIVARMAQGAGGGLLTPGSLAILGATFEREDRAAAIGAWSGLGGVAIAVGPLLGGWLVRAGSWRWVFFLNVPVAAAVLMLARAVPETRDPTARGPVDVLGAALAAVGLAGVTLALSWGTGGGQNLRSIGVGLFGLLALIAGMVVEMRRRAPLIPLGLFRSSPFAAANAETLIIYASLSGALFLLPIMLQTTAGYSPVASGAALLPATLLLLLLSSHAGRLAEKIGPRLPMAVGPMIVALGFAWLALRSVHSGYLEGVLPGVLSMGLGLAITVAPLTSTVIAAAPPDHAGVASAINNCIARTGSLLMVATLPAAVGLSGALNPSAVAAAFRPGMLVCSICVLIGGVIGAIWIRRPQPEAVPPGTSRSCPLDAPTLCGLEHLDAKAR
jgi:EmrB/QacA subfamily drug resistance transporter